MGLSPVSHYQSLQSHQQPLLPLQLHSQYQQHQQHQQHLQHQLTPEQLGQLAIASLSAGGGKKRPRESGDELLLVSITSVLRGLASKQAAGCWLDHRSSLNC